ncbi:hypothetical protein FS749_014056 [Ceratobasidium sp. UAMH 11750]|nr:hypothetical protein FS749_014056 [Ceratobasidium sp. UAMH 11750]
MPYNVTIDDISPLITYTGQWLDSYRLPPTADQFVNRYWGETFHSSQTDGSQMSLTFNGTAIYIFGAKRGNHGHYIVTIDNDKAQTFDGYAPKQLDGTDGVFQVPIFAQTGLPDGLHTVVLTNDGGADGDRPFVDIDFITWTSNEEAHSNITLDDGAFTYTTPSVPWSTSSIYVGDYYNKTEHATNVAGATASLTFEGTGFYLYGGTLNDHGQFSVAVNDHAPVVLNGSTNGYHSRVPLYYADGLGEGTHKLVVTNTQSGTWLDIDYIDIIQTKGDASASNPSGTAKTPIIAGVVCGVVIGLAWLIAAVWWFMRRRKRRSDSADLLNQESKPYEVPPVGYGPASGGPGWNDSSTAGRDQPWPNDPAYTGAFSQSDPRRSGSYPMGSYPLSSVSGSQGPGSSSGSGSAYGGATSPGRPSAQHQPLSTLTQASESDVHVNQMVPPPNVKGRPAVVASTGSRGDLTEDELRETRMRVPERPQDWGPVDDLSEHDMLPPDYNQVSS